MIQENGKWLLLIFVFAIGCTKDSTNSESILDFMQENYFETTTKIDDKIYSYDLIQFDFSESCVMRIRSQYVIEFGCYWDNLNDCSPLLTIKDVVIKDDEILFKGVKGQNTGEHDLDMTFKWNKLYNDIELWIEGTPVGGYVVKNKTEWDIEYLTTSCED